MRLARPLAAVLLLGALPLAAQDPAARLDSAMRAAAARGFTGAVRIDRDGRTLLERGYGEANRAKGIAFGPSTVVQVGSNTKDFTAVAILQLVERGALSLGDSLGRFFPSAPADRRGITVRQLLDHRAGFPMGLGGDFEPVSRERMIDSAMHVRLLFPPGARESYSNTGYSLLAAIIEQVSGKSYDEYVRDAIIAPLGLRHTGFLLPRFSPDEQAHGYLPSGADAGTMLDKPHAPDGPWWNLRGNGGMLSTLDDMHAFYDTLFTTTRLLSVATRRLKFDPDQPIGLAGSDGVHFFLYERDPRTHTTLEIASTNAAVKAPQVRDALAELLGLPVDRGPGERIAQRAGAHPPPPAIADLLTTFVRTMDAGDTLALRRFVEEHFAQEPDAPSVEQRVSRFHDLRDRLGALTIQRIDAFDDAPPEVIVRAALGGTTIFRVRIDREAPYRIHAIQVEVQGG